MELEGLLTPVLAIAGIIASIAYFVSVIRNGKSKADSDTLDTMKEEIAVLKGKVERLENDNTSKDKEIARLSGRVEELSRENAELKNTLALRDPEFTKTMKGLCENIAKMIQSIDDLNKEANERYEKILARIGCK